MALRPYRFSVKIAKKWSPRKRKFVFNIEFRVLPAVTERTVAVREAFGMGVDKEQVFPVYKDFTLELALDDVVYITGPSGSGKSVLLRALRRELGPLAADMSEVEVRPGVPIVETLGRDLDEAIELLTRAGLGDAFLWLRTYEELSDGQKYRYRLAKLMESGAQVWVCDEFCSTLDRDTAKLVAYSVQKLARRLGRGLIVATCHSDLFDDLRPSVFIRKGLGAEVEVRYYPNKPARECSLLREVEFGFASPGERREAIKLVESWHYRGRRVPYKRVFVARRGGRVIGAVLLSPPYVSCWGRKLVFERVPSLRELNRWLYTASRVVVHPAYRGMGLGSRLLRRALLASDRPYVELVAVMARYNPFAERAGMLRAGEKEPDPALETAAARLAELGVDPRLMASERYALRVLSGMSDRELVMIKDILRPLRNIGLTRALVRDRNPFLRPGEWEEALNRAGRAELARLLSVLASIRARKIYLIWRDPRMHMGSCPLDDYLRPEWRERLARLCDRGA